MAVHSPSPQPGQEAHEHHIVPIRDYLLVYALLLFLLVVTVYASFVNLGPFNNLIPETLVPSLPFAPCISQLHVPSDWRR